MKGFKDKDGVHIIFSDDEMIDLIAIMNNGVKIIQKRSGYMSRGEALMGLTWEGKFAVAKSVHAFSEKFGVVLKTCSKPKQS